MPYSNDLKVFWFTPIRTASRACINLQEHLKFEDLYSHSLFHNSQQKDYYFISNIRNPYSRLVSIFFLFCNNNNRDTDNFPIWVTKNLKEGLINVPAYQIRLESLYSNEIRYPDYYVRIENLEEDIRNLWFVKENMSLDLEKIIQDTIISNQYLLEFGDRKPWQEFYDEELANYVYSFLEKDFLLFGYDKNSWKNGTS